MVIHSGQSYPLSCGSVNVILRVARGIGCDAEAVGGQAVVLLSPACASFDQFPNFEVRGDYFRTLVMALPGVAPVKP